MNEEDVEPGIRRFFPWALFLVVAIIFLYGAATTRAHGANQIDVDPYSCFGGGRYEAMSEGRSCPPQKEPSEDRKYGHAYSCANLREYLKFHTEEEARAEAVRLHFPRWVIRLAERCPK